KEGNSWRAGSVSDRRTEMLAGTQPPVANAPGSPDPSCYPLCRCFEPGPLFTCRTALLSRPGLQDGSGELSHGNRMAQESRPTESGPGNGRGLSVKIVRPVVPAVR